MWRNSAKLQVGRTRSPQVTIMEGYSRKLPRKQLRLIPDQWTLSQAVLKHPQSCDEKRVSLVSKSIALIDAVAEQFKSAESLHLSGNLIKDLTNIGQFYKLRSLSLAGNQLDQISQLLPLKALARLENLNLEGNPVCVLPGYREFLISKLPSLRSLDGKEVTPPEREKAKSLVEQMEAAEDVAAANEEIVSRLQHLLKTLKLHKQLLLTRGLECYAGVDVKRLIDWEKPTWPEGLRLQVKTVLRNKVKEIAGERIDEGSVLGAYSDCLQTQQELIERLSAACEDQAKTCKSLWIQPREKLKPKKPPTPSSKPVPPSSSMRAPEVRKDYSDVQTRYHQLIHPKRSLSSTSSRPASVLKEEVEERPQQLRAPVQDHEKPRKWSDAEDESVKLTEQNRMLRQKLKEFEQANHDNVLMAEEELRRMNEKLQTAMAENQRLREKEKEAVDTIASLSAVHSHIEDRCSRLVYTSAEQGSIHSTIEDGLSLVVDKFKNTKLLQRVWRALLDATERSMVLREFRDQGVRVRQAEVGMLCLAAWKWLAKTSKYVKFKAEQRTEALVLTIMQRWKRFAHQRKGLFALSTARKEWLLRCSFHGWSSFPAAQQERLAEKRVATKMCEMHRLFSTFAAWKSCVGSWRLSEFETSHLLRTADIADRLRLLRLSWSGWMRWREEVGKPLRLAELRAYSHYADSLRYRVLNLLISNLERSRQLVLSAHAMSRMKQQKSLLKYAKALKKFVLVRRHEKALEHRAFHFHLKSTLHKLKSAVSIRFQQHNLEEAAISHYFKYLLRKIFRGQRNCTEKRRQLTASFAQFQESHRLKKAAAVMNRWLLALWRQSQSEKGVEKRRIFSYWYRAAAHRHSARLKTALANRAYVHRFQSSLRTLLQAWSLVKKRRLRVESVAESISRTVKQKLAVRSFALWRDIYSRAIFSRVQVNMTSLAQAESSLVLQSQRVKELADDNESLKKQLAAAEEQIRELAEARSALENQVRNFQKGDNEAALLISKLERDFAASASSIRQLQRDKETLARNFESQLSVMREDLKSRERELARAEQALMSATDFRRQVADSTDEHVLEVVSASDKLLEQLREKESQLEEALQDNEELAEKLRRSEAKIAELESARVQRSPSPPSLQPRTLLPYLDMDAEPVRLPSPEEDQIQEHLLTLKQERAAIREEIESRMKKVDGRQRHTARTTSDSGLLDISSRMASLEARLASKLK